MFETGNKPRKVIFYPFEAGAVTEPPVYKQKSLVYFFVSNYKNPYFSISVFESKKNPALIGHRIRQIKGKGN
jgi:hypothetical protein